MTKKNCWEFRDCGRQPGGVNVKKYGLCPASTLTAVNGINGGINGGRTCWALTGTMSGPTEKVQGIFARTISSCYACKFYEQVMLEESEHFQGTAEIVRILRERIARAAERTSNQKNTISDGTKETMRAGS